MLGVGWLRGRLATLQWRSFADAAPPAGGASKSGGGPKARDPGPPPGLLDAEVVPPGGAGGEKRDEYDQDARRTTPFRRFMHSYSPAKGEGIQMIFAAIMLSMSIKFMRQRGEALEREKRYEERIARVKYELAAIEVHLGEELRAKVQELPAKDKTTVRQFFLEQDRSEWLQQVVSKTVARAKQIAKEQFEASLWTDVESELPAAAEPKPAAEGGEKAVLY